MNLINLNLGLDVPADVVLVRLVPAGDGAGAGARAVGRGFWEAAVEASAFAAATGWGLVFIYL